MLFGTSCALTGVALFCLGAFKSRFVTQTWYWSGVTMLINGGLAAAAAFLIGYGCVCACVRVHVCACVCACVCVFMCV